MYKAYSVVPREESLLTFEDAAVSEVWNRQRTANVNIKNVNSLGGES